MTTPRHANSPAGSVTTGLAGLLARIAHRWAASHHVRAQSAPLVEEIEARLLYSADPAGAGLMLAGAGAVVEQRLVDDHGEFKQAAETVQRSHELLIVGVGIEDSRTLLDGLVHEDRDIEVLVLDPGSDAMTQISAALAGRSDLSAIHILSHGASGQLQLQPGADAVDAAVLAARASEVGRWGDALRTGGDILLYGCDVAAGDSGAAFVRQLAALTGADVAASQNLTGAASLHGDWTLEFATGGIEAGIAFTQQAQVQWTGVLETLVNTVTANNQTQPAVAVGASGNYVVTWTSDGNQDGNATGVFARLFDAAGNPVGSQFQVNTISADRQESSAVGMAADGSFVVVWADHSGQNGDTTGWGIQGQRFNADGSRAGGQFLVNQLTAGDQTQPSISVAADGQFVVAWSSSANNDVYVRHFSALGVALNGDVLVNKVNPSGTQNNPQVSWAGSFYIVVWQSDSGGTGKSIFAQFLNAQDKLNGGGFKINTYDTNDQTVPSLATDSKGNFVVTWMSAGQDGDLGGIYAQLYKPSGTPQGAEFRVNTVTVKNQSNPTVSMDGSGNFIIAWVSQAEDAGDTLGVYAQRYDPTGAPVGSAFLVNTTTANNQSAPSVSTNGGATVIAWQGNGIGDTNGVFAANYAANRGLPSTGPDAATVTQGGQVLSAAPGVLANDIDGNGSAALSVVSAGSQSVTTPSPMTSQGILISGLYGTLLMRAEGSYQYTADAAAAYALAAGQTASDVFTYQVKNNFNATASGTLSITVAGLNDAPVAVNDSYAVDKFGVLTVPASGVLANDKDPDAVPAPDVLAVTGVSNGVSGTVGQPVAGQYGTLTLNADGSLSYRPDLLNALVSALSSTQSLTDSFTYQVADAAGATSTATISIAIVGSNTAPVARNDAYTMQQGAVLATPAASGVLVNDSDADNNVVSAVLVSGPAHGSLNLKPDGSFVYTPDPLYYGSDSFTYKANDGSLSSASAATVDLTIVHVNHPPAAAEDFVAVVQDATVGRPAGGVLINDSDPDGDALTVSGVGFGANTVSVAAGTPLVLTSNYGTLTIGSDGAYSYLANGAASCALGAGEVSSDTWVYTISDGQGASASANLVFTITGVNDAPTISGTLAGQPSRDDSSLSPFSGVTVGDVDNPAQTLNVTITLDSAQKGALSNLGGCTYDAVAGVYRVSGSAAQVTDSLAGLLFTPTANRVAPGTTETTTFTLAVSDGVTSTSDATTSVVATSINDGPTISGTRAGQAVNDNGTLNPFSGVTIGDVDNPGQTLTATVSLDDPAKGGLTNLGGGSYDAATGVYKVTGSAQAVGAALAGLLFNPSANRVAPGLTETTRFTLDLNDGLATTTDAVTSVVATSINDAPTITGALALQTVNDDASLRPFATVAIADADSPAQTLSLHVLLDDPARGALSGAVGSYDAAAGVYTYAGTAAEVTAALRALLFAPTTNRVAPGSMESTRFTLQVDDGAASATDASTVVQSLSINDVPSISGAVAGQSVNDNASLTPFSTITIADPDNPAQTLTVRVALDNAASGALSGTVGSYDAASGVYTFIGSAAAATNALRALAFTPTPNQVAPGLTVTTRFTVSANDGQAAASDSSTTVAAASINDAPQISGTSGGRSTSDAGSLRPFAAVTLSDADSPAQRLTVRVALDNPARGMLSSAAGSYDAASGTYTFAGTAAQATADLQSVVFTPTANRLAPGLTETAVLTLTANDGLAASTDSATTVDVTSVNDAPVIGGLSTAPQAADDNAGLRPFGSATVADADSPAQQLTLQVSLDDPAHGVLSATAGAYDAAAGIYTFTGTAAEAGAALQVLVFTPTANRVAPGLAETTRFTVSVSDGQATTSNAGTAVTATSANDAPTITGALALQSVNDDGSVRPFATVTIADADSPAQPLSVRVTLDDQARGSLSSVGGSYDAARGVFAFTGTATEANAVLQALAFTPVANRVSPGAAEITRLALDVTDCAAAVRAATSIVATSVNDAPVLVLPVGVQTVADNSSLAPFAGMTVADADSPAQWLTLRITLDDPAKGRLSGAAGSYDAAAGVYTLQGTAAEINAAVQALRFSPVENRVSPGQVETVTFGIIVSDGAADASGALSVAALSINDAPEALPISASGVQDGTSLAIVLAARDADGDGMRIVITGVPEHGALFLDTAGLLPLQPGALLAADGGAVSVYFRPDAGWTGDTGFRYAAVDTHGLVGKSVAAGITVAPSLRPTTPATAPAAEAAVAPVALSADRGEQIAAAPTQLAGAGAVAAVASAPPSDAPAQPPETSLPGQASPQQTSAPAPARISAERAAQAGALLTAADSPASQSEAALAADLSAAQALADTRIERASAAARSETLTRALDEMRDSVKAAEESEHRIVGSSVAVGASFSVGYVIWLLRGGVLATSLLSSLPAWRFVDPLPVLARMRQDDDDDSDDSLESLVADDVSHDDHQAHEAHQAHRDHGDAASPLQALEPTP